MKEEKNSAWSNMEEWGQGSWFKPSQPRAEEVADAIKNHYPDADFDSPDIVKGGSKA